MNAVVRFSDPYWADAAAQALKAAQEAECVLVPADFLSMHPKFAPLEFSWALRNFARLAWCCSKDDVDRLAPWLHADAARIEQHAWSNEVFVLGGNFKWHSPASSLSKKHLAAWFERLARYRKGVSMRSSHARPVSANAIVALHTATPLRRPRALIVGASNMGNVGDDLLADVLSGMIAETGAEVFLSGPDIDPLEVSKYSAVIVGGGGLIYASRDGSNETQNLANYLKFGPLCRHFNIPVGLIGVGDQDHARGIERDALTQTFTQRCLQDFESIITRDASSAQLLERVSRREVRTGSDPVFALYERASRAVRSTAPPARYALIGEFYDYDLFAKGLTDGHSPLSPAVRDKDFDLLVMSDDDVNHCHRMQSALVESGASASVVDLRGRDFEALIFLFATYRAVITTRFHGLILAALANTPVSAVDSENGKKARLLRDVGADELLLSDEFSAASKARIIAALSNQIAPLPLSKVQGLAAQTTLHRNALHSLVGGMSELTLHAFARTDTARARPPFDTTSSIEDAQSGSIALCWAASSPHTNGYGNLGDSLSAVMVGALAGKPVRHANFDENRTKLVAVGSIGHAIKDGTAVIWGSGVSIRGGVLADNVRRTNYDVRSIRGPISAQHYRDFGIAVPDVYGDPVWLLPSILNEPVEKRFELGVIPHIQDIEQAHPASPPKADSLRFRLGPGEQQQIAIINTWHEATWNGLLEKIRLIRSCKRIVSQSFHGVVIAEAFGIPVLNFRTLPGSANGLVKIDLDQPCTTDPRIWEFFKAGPRATFPMYSQRRDERSDWNAIMKAIDSTWSPFEYDATAMVNAFPLPLAYDPLSATINTLEHLRALSF
jgi:polysaccharide pyruvyl transferase WcaK-like protein